MEGSGGPAQIVFSQDMLRTEIRAANAELELNLRKFVGEEMARKADVTAVSGVESDVRGFREGLMTEAQKRAVVDIVQEELTVQKDAGWTKRERMIAVLGLVLWSCSIAVGLFSLIHHG